MRTRPHVLRPPQPLCLTLSKLASRGRKERKGFFFRKELFFPTAFLLGKAERRAEAHLPLLESSALR